MTTVILHTNVGDIRLNMYDDMPITAGNFVELAKKGFYDGVIFHRVIEGFMIQGGDPTGTGMGGPGYTIDDEFVKGHSNVRGTISMANTGRPHTGGSQFFINTADNNYLDWDDSRTPSKHPVFGECADEESYKIVLMIERSETDYNDRPVEEKKILKAEVHKLGENIPPLVNSYMNLSPTMKIFGTAINDEFGDVLDTGLLIDFEEIKPEKKHRHAHMPDLDLKRLLAKLRRKNAV